MYEVCVERHAEKDLKSLPKEIFHKIMDNILALQYNPRPVNSRKLTGSANDWRIRVGNYRIIYSYDKASDDMVIHLVGLRDSIYQDIRH